MLSRPFQITRNLNRYREIAQVLVKYGFGDVVNRVGLQRYLALPRQFGRSLRGGNASLESDLPLNTPERLRMMLEELGPTFIKLGQILSTRPDLLPLNYILELEKLQDAVPPDRWERIQARIERELGRPLSEAFAWVDESPLAAASLAQVHAARLHNGTEVVIKVQRPDIERTIEVDLAILNDLARLFQGRLPLARVYDLPAIAEDFAYTLNMELDYRNEGRHADRFRQNFAGKDYLHVPVIYWEYSARRVLVMERITGLKIDNPAGLVEAGYNPHRLALKAAQFIIKEIFEDGFFHADPHPGNLIVMPGEVIGLIDYGMVGWLSREDRLNLMRLYIAGVRLNDEAIIDTLIGMGITNGSFDRDALRRDIVRLLRRYYGLPLAEVRASVLLNELISLAFRHELSLPTDLWLLSKTLVIMEGVGKKLDPDFDIFAVSEPYVAKLRWQLLRPENWLPPLSKSAGDWATLLMDSPEMALDVLAQLKQGDLSGNLNISNLNDALASIDRLVSRLSVSLILAALILGLAYLIPNIQASNTLLQTLVVGAFVVVSGLSLRLLWSVFRSGV